MVPPVLCVAETKSRSRLAVVDAVVLSVREHAQHKVSMIPPASVCRWSSRDALALVYVASPDTLVLFFPGPRPRERYQAESEIIDVRWNPDGECLALLTLEGIEVVTVGQRGECRAPFIFNGDFRACGWATRAVSTVPPSIHNGAFALLTAVLFEDVVVLHPTAGPLFHCVAPLERVIAWSSRGELAGRQDWLREEEEDLTKIIAAEWSPDGTLLALLRDTYVVTVWRMRDKKKVLQVRDATSMAWSGGSGALLVGSRSGLVMRHPLRKSALPAFVKARTIALLVALTLRS